MKNIEIINKLETYEYTINEIEESINELLNLKKNLEENINLYCIDLLADRFKKEILELMNNEKVEG